MNRQQRKGVNVFALVLAICMILLGTTPYMATENSSGNLQATTEPAESVMTISLGYQTDGGTYYPIQYGTCFLINDEYVLTNFHVLYPDSTFLDQASSLAGTAIQSTDSHIKCKIHITRDIMVDGTAHKNVQSEVMDFVLVKMNEKVYDRKPLLLGDSDKVAIKDQVYAMGFPADSVSTREYFTKEDVSVTDGTISKITNTGTEELFEHTAIINFGNSGGPLLDEENRVIGINVAKSASKYYAVRINFVKKTMDTFGIPYLSETTSTPEPTQNTETTPATQTQEPQVNDNSAILATLRSTIDEAKDIETAKYTEESINDLDDAIGKAESIVKNTSATAAEINGAMDELNKAMDKLQEKPEGPNVLLIGGVAGAVVVVIIIVVVVMSGKKKPKDTTPGGTISTAPPVQPTPMPTATMQDGAGETTLLNAGAGETTLLGATVGNAYLIRKKNGEKIAINAARFKMGKERSKVNYCIPDNTSVSRVHCEIIKKGADYYIVDNGATNFTFVNGIQASPHREMLLTDKCTIKLSDEEFQFYLS